MSATVAVRQFPRRPAVAIVGAAVAVLRGLSDVIATGALTGRIAQAVRVVAVVIAVAVVIQAIIAIEFGAGWRAAVIGAVAAVFSRTALQVATESHARIWRHFANRGGRQPSRIDQVVGSRIGAVGIAGGDRVSSDWAGYDHCIGSENRGIGGKPVPVGIGNLPLGQDSPVAGLKPLGDVVEHYFDGAAADIRSGRIG